jgi:hypothetical protein
VGVEKVDEVFEGQCKTIAVRDGVPRPGERCELPADHSGPHVFPVAEAGATRRCPAWEPGRGLQCELTAGHDEGEKASPHMVDRGEGVPPLVWDGAGEPAPGETPMPGSQFPPGFGEVETAPGETVAEAARQTAAAAHERAAGQTSGTRQRSTRRRRRPRCSRRGTTRWWCRSFRPG